jgi:uncharacterized protein YjbI with pentapeptide repeats
MPDASDPNDVAGLERSLNDSATRVSTLWISYLLFGLYLLVAAGTATHRQLLLEEPLKLPALGSDVPLVWFFLVSPVLFVLLHFYLLLQVLLLGRTAQAYNRALNLALPVRSDNARFRQRLANTLFAQFFAGAPRERRGSVGRIIRAIAWITLIAGPIYLIFTFQLGFLPYHSPIVTWTHRFLICVEASIAIVFWPIVVDPRKDLSWSRLANRAKRFVVFPVRFFSASIGGMRTLLPVLAHYLSRSMYVLLIVASVFLITFPGERHINFIALDPLDSVKCERTFSFGKHFVEYAKQFNSFVEKFDRLSVINVNVADADKVGKWNADASPGQRRYQGTRSKDLSGRDLNCGTFDSVDFRRANLEETHLQGSSLQYTRLDGAWMRGIVLDDAVLTHAHMNEVNLDKASLRRTKLDKATLNSSSMVGAKFQAPDFSLANLVGLDLRYLFLQGANFIEADMRGANLTGAHLEGASLQRARLDGAKLNGTSLFAADLENAQLQGADLSPAPSAANFAPSNEDRTNFSMTRMRKTRLNLSEMREAVFNDALISEAFLWGAMNMDCSHAFFLKPDTSQSIRLVPDFDPRETEPPDAKDVQSTPRNFMKLRYDLEYTISRKALDQLEVRFNEASKGTANQTNCSDSLTTAQFDPAVFANRIADRVCNPSSPYIKDSRREVAAGIVRNALDPNPKSESKSKEYIAVIAARFLGCMRNELFDRDLEALSGWQKRQP